MASRRAALFFTRLAAHLCAPVFVALTGLGAWLYGSKKGGAAAASGFLFKRGLFLVLLILMHKGKGGGLSDMFGGGMSSALGSSGLAERNLNRITVGMAVAWFATVVALGIIK